MHRIFKVVKFEAAHQLTRFPEGHKCARNHGHNYRVELTLSSHALDEMDVVVDYGVLSEAIRKRYDHQNLNDFQELRNNPTAERIAVAIVDLLELEVLHALNENLIGTPGAVVLERVRVYETDDSWAEWTHDDVEK